VDGVTVDQEAQRRPNGVAEAAVLPHDLGGVELLDEFCACG